MQPQVCLYGVERFGVKADALDREHKGKRFSVLPLEADLQLKGLAQLPDLVIATANPMLAQTAGSATYEASNLQMLSNVRMALEQGVSFCFIENGAVRDTQVVGSAAQKSLGYKVLAEDFSIGFNPTELSNEFTKVNPYFDHFLKNHGFTSVGFNLPQNGAGEIDVVARLRKDGRAAAVARKQGRGMLIVVPAQPQALELDFFADLADGCLNYVRAKTTDIPAYVEEFHFAEEQPIVKELEALNAQLLKIKKKFGDFTPPARVVRKIPRAQHRRLAQRRRAAFLSRAGRKARRHRRDQEHGGKRQARAFDQASTAPRGVGAARRLSVGFNRQHVHGRRESREKGPACREPRVRQGGPGPYRDSAHD